MNLPSLSDIVDGATDAGSSVSQSLATAGSLPLYGDLWELDGGKPMPTTAGWITLAGLALVVAVLVFK